MITWGCWRIFPVLSSMKARSAERGWKVWGYAILAGCCTSFALQSMKIESSWQWILTIIWQFNSEMKHPLSLRCHKSYVSKEGMKRDAIQQPSTFHIRNLLHHKVFTPCNLLCQQPFTTLRKVLQREGFRPTTFSWLLKKGWKTQRTHPPLSFTNSGFTVTHIYTPHFRFRKKICWPPVSACHEHPGKRPHSLSASGVPPPRTLTEWYLSQNCLKLYLQRQKRGIYAFNLGGFSHLEPPISEKKKITGRNLIFPGPGTSKVSLVFQ